MADDLLDEPTDLPSTFDPFDEPFEPVKRRSIPRSRQLLGVLVAVAMMMIPLWNVIDSRSPQIADNGLEVCSFDYCEVQDAVADAGFNVTMAGLARIIVPDHETQALADTLLEVVDGPAVRVEVVDSISTGVGGRYVRSERLIQIERPATVWVVAHEVAHTVSTGHDDNFVTVLLELATFLDAGR